MKQHKITAMLLALVMLAGVTGCADKGSSSPESSAVTTTTTVTETTQAPETTEAPETERTTTKRTTEETTKTTTTSGSTTSETGSTTSKTQTTGTTGAQQQTSKTTTSTTAQPPKSTEPAYLRTMQSLTDSGEVYSLMPAGGSTVAMQMHSGSRDYVYLIDVEKDAVTAKVQIGRYEWLLGVSKAGEIITDGYSDHDNFYFYDSASGKLASSAAYSGSAYSIRYDRDRDQLYGYRDRRAYEISRTGYDSTAYAMPGSSSDEREYVAEYFHSRGLVLKRELSSNDYTGVDYTLTSTVSGENVFSVLGEFSDFKLTDRSLIRVDSDGSQDDETYKNAFVFNLATGKETARYLIGNNGSDLIADPQSAVCMVLSSGSKGKDSWGPLGAYMLDAETGKRENLGMSFKNAEAQQACYLPDAGVWVYALTTKQNGKLSTAVMRIDPEQVPYSTAKQRAAQVGLAEAEKPIGDAVRARRARADELEKRFGIRILIGNEVLRVKGLTSFYMVSTEDTSYWEYMDSTNTDDLDRALTYLERELGRYPAGFFEIFKTNGIGGLRIELTLDLPPDASMQNFGSAGGLSFRTGAFYDIAFNLSMCYEYDKSIHHELFHQVEHRMQDLDYCYSDSDWAKLNPKNYTYLSLMNYGSAAEDMCMYNSSGVKENVYFARNYGMSNEMEDRATIMERVFERLYDEETEQEVCGYEFLQQFPHLKAKLGEMAKLVKACFGSVYWEDIYNAGVLN